MLLSACPLTFVPERVIPKMLRDVQATRGVIPSSSALNFLSSLIWA